MANKTAGQAIADLGAYADELAPEIQGIASDYDYFIEQINIIQNSPGVLSDVDQTAADNLQDRLKARVDAVKALNARNEKAASATPS